jgi:hypothetical protein
MSEVTAGTAVSKKPATVVNSIKMQDGTVVDFPGKRKMQKSSFKADDGSLKVRLDFINGEVRVVTLAPTLVEKYALHGAEQKLGDETAGETDVDDMVLAIDQLVGRLDKGEWTVSREAGGMSGTSILVKALVEYNGRSVESVKQFLSDKTQAQKMALRGALKPNAQGVTLKSIVDRLEAEKLAKGTKVDTDELLAGFDALPQDEAAVPA